MADAFETLISVLLRHQGYWTTPNVRVELTKAEKRQIGKSTTPRWELDLVAYKPSKNDLLIVECKSFLDSTGVVFRNGTFEPEKRYKLFTDRKVREVVRKALRRQLCKSGSCDESTNIRPALAIGKIANKTDRDGLQGHFKRNGWELFDPEWVRKELLAAKDRGYENDIAFVVSKILLRAHKTTNSECQMATTEIG